MQNNIQTILWAIFGCAMGLIGVRLFFRIAGRERSRGHFMGAMAFTLFLLLCGMTIARALAGIIQNNPKATYQAITEPYFTVLWFIVAMALFWIRGSRPVWYGVLEVFIGTTAIFYAIYSQPDGFPENLTSKLLALASGIYIIVRGLDNIDKGVPERYKFTWKKLFPKPPNVAP